MSITEFLAARLDEEEAVARAALEEGGAYDDTEIPWAGRAGDDSHSREHNYGASWVELRVARILADIAAKRALIADLATFDRVATEKASSDPATSLTARGIERGIMHALRTLVQPFTDHPDFDESWKP
jgi:hypothetical protein